MNLSAIISSIIIPKNRKLEKFVFWYLGSERHEEYKRLIIKEGYKPLDAFDIVFEKTLKYGDPRLKNQYGPRVRT